VYHLSVKTVSRSAGRSAPAAGAYRSGQKIKDERTGETHDYSRKKGVVHHEILSPAAHQVEVEASALWNQAEACENRKNSCTAREFEVALPSDLDAGQRRELAAEFAAELVQRYGFAAQLDIHEPSRGGDQRNHHAHILCTTRRMDAAGQLGEKTRELDNQRSGEIEHVRALWERLCNEHLERAQRETRVDHRSHAARGLEDLPTIHHGPAATAISRRGEYSLRVERSGQIQGINLDRAFAPLNELDRQERQIPPVWAREPDPADLPPVQVQTPAPKPAPGPQNLPQEPRSEKKRTPVPIRELERLRGDFPRLQALARERVLGQDWDRALLEAPLKKQDVRAAARELQERRRELEMHPAHQPNWWRKPFLTREQKQNYADQVREFNRDARELKRDRAELAKLEKEASEAQTRAWENADKIAQEQDRILTEMQHHFEAEARKKNGPDNGPELELENDHNRGPRPR